MKITIRAAGLIKSGPERDLIDSYLKRANGIARSVGITEISENGVDIRSAKSRAQETEIILSYPQHNTPHILIVLDEKGKSMTSRHMAKAIANWRDDGQKHIIFAIGGADGFAPSALPAGTFKWNLGAQTWPHKLVRVMISEQIYRAVSILSGSPYHRD